MRCELTYWANHNDLLGDHHGWCTYYIASIFGKICFFLTASAFEMKGVISSVIFNMDGTVEFSLGWGEFYSFIEVRNLKIVGDVHLLWFPLVYLRNSGNPWSVSVSRVFFRLKITVIIFSSYFFDDKDERGSGGGGNERTNAERVRKRKRLKVILLSSKGFDP